MRKKAATSTRIVVFMLWVSAALAQQSPVDSLRKQLLQQMPDTARVLLLDQLGYHLMYSKPIEAMQYAQQGLDLASKINFARGRVRTLNRLGSILRITGNYAKSLEMHFGSLKLAETIDDPEGIARTLNNIGILYLDQKELKKAINYFFSAKTAAEQIPDPALIQIISVNIGTGYALQNQLDSARVFVQQAYQSAKDKKGSTSNTLLISLGNIHYRMGEYQRALNYYRLSLPYLKAVENNRLLSQTYFEMAQVFQGMKRPDSCTYYAQRALDLAQSANNYKYVFEAGSLLSSLYENQDKSKAFDYFRLATAAKDSIFNQEKVKQVQNLSFNEQLRQQELLITQKAFESRRKMYVLLGVIGFILLLAAALYRNNRLKQKANTILQKQKEALLRQKEQLQVSLQRLKDTQAQLIQKEKLASLGELTAGIAHEIQNPLNFVNNFAEISAELVQEIKELKEQKQNRDEEETEIWQDIEQNLKKIHFHGQRASGIVKSMLEHSRASSGERIPTDVNQLADEYLRLSYHGMRAKMQNGQSAAFNAAYELVADQNLPLISVVPQDLGRVLLNLINNAFYAVAARAAQTGSADGDGMMAVLAAYQPKVTVCTRFLPPPKGESESEGWAEIRVKDNGTGIDETTKTKIFQPFFTTKPTGEGTGLGLSLSYDIITKGYGGTLEVDSVPDRGTEFSIKLPIQPLTASKIPE
ncbi:MAG: tetratricopeptide repeat protein [Spirosomataceae bacterium]